jgi:hypothetical protein
MKNGTIWKIENYKLYINNGYGKLKQIDGQNYLQYEITDVKKSNVKHFSIVALKLIYKVSKYELYSEEYINAIYDKKNKTFTTIEPELGNSKFGFVNLSILKNGKLRVKYLDEDTHGYVVDLPKIKC